MKAKRIILVAVILLLIAGTAAGSFYLGYGAGFKIGKAEPRSVSLDIKNINSSSSTSDFNLFWQAWKIIKDEALKGAEVNDTDLLRGAIKGLVGSLGDPYSVYLPPADARKFEEDISGSFGGVGMEIGIRNSILVVVAPLKGTPAERAGLKAKDQILKIDDAFTADLGVEEAVKLIRGKVGTEVKLLILRDDWDKPKDFTIKREIIQIPTLDFEMKPGDIAYIHLYNFNESAPAKFFEALGKAEDAQARGIILDLRNNPGGFLEVATNLAGWFIKRGDLIVSEEMRSGAKQELKSIGSGSLNQIPTVVLVNDGSASASEILAGALRDQLKVKLIGTKTFGKGSVQTLLKLTDGSTVKVTIAKWVLPSGLVIEKNGLDPDIKVEISDEDAKNGKDPQLEKAQEIMRELLKNTSAAGVENKTVQAPIYQVIITAVETLKDFLFKK